MLRKWSGKNRRIKVEPYWNVNRCLENGVVRIGELK